MQQYVIQTRPSNMYPFVCHSDMYTQQIALTTWVSANPKHLQLSGNVLEDFVDTITRS